MSKGCVSCGLAETKDFAYLLDGEVVVVV